MGREVHPRPSALARVDRGFQRGAPPIPQDARLDELFVPADLIQVVDADSSQTIVVETVRREQNIVVQGPPGTGKSQTIANIIAAAVHDGSTVLFVAEKMAALNVVYDRLKKVGLGPICLQLHSRNANKRLVLDELDRTLNYNATGPDVREQCERLKELRDMLNAADKRMHAQVGETGMTPFQALSRLVCAAENRVISDANLLLEADTWSKSQYAAVVQAAKQLSDITAVAGPLHHHPYRGVRATSLQPGELARLTEPLSALANAASKLAERVEEIAIDLGLEQEATLSLCLSLAAILQTIEAIPPEAADIALAIAAQSPLQILEASRLGIVWTNLKTAHSETFVEPAWDTAATEMRLSLTGGLTFFGRFKSSYRRASKRLASIIRVPLPRSAQHRIALVDSLIGVGKAREELEAVDAEMGTMLPAHWRGQDTDFELLYSVSFAIQRLASQHHVARVESIVEFGRRGLAQELYRGTEATLGGLCPGHRRSLACARRRSRRRSSVEARDNIPLRSLAAKAHSWRELKPRFDEWRRLVNC